MASFTTSPTPYLCDLPGWNGDGSAAAAQAAAADTTARGKDALRRAIAWEASIRRASPPTPGRVEPDIAFFRAVFGSGKLTMPDGREIRHWGFEDEHGTRSLPSPLIRVRQGQVVHVTLATSMGPHTIHLHGIEPDDHNDGVGHTSFDVSGQYTYQFKPAQAGTYFYHCHVNTVLHVAMGLFGGLVVDPPEGPGRAWQGGPAYDVEAFWVGHNIEPRLETLSHGAGLAGEDVGLNEFNPEYFLINGVAHPETKAAEGVAVEARTGETILVRLLNANYHPQRWVFDGLDAEFIASDARPFERSYVDREITMAPAERYDLLLKPRKPGTYRARVETLHWITGKLLGVAETTITVTGPALPDPEPGRPQGPDRPQPEVPRVETHPAPSEGGAQTPAPGVPDAGAQGKVKQAARTTRKAKAKPKPKAKAKPKPKPKPKAKQRKRPLARRKKTAAPAKKPKRGLSLRRRPKRG